MAVFAGSDLKKWRDEQNISAADLAERIGCDPSTIYKYESRKLVPDPNVMFQICEALGDIDRWTIWMRTEYPISYGRMHPETAPFNLPGALMSMYAEMADVLDIQREVLRDGADGTINDPELAEELQRQVTEMIQAAQRVKSLAGKTGKANG